MLDQYKRKIDYLRISVTDRCNLHCAYCQPQQAAFVPHAEILRYEEILRICQLAVQLGISKFKITGGEPLLRKDCCSLISRLKKLEGVEQVTLTTNGTLLAQFLPQLVAAGVDCVNVSLDTSEAETYARLTGGRLQEVLQALDALAGSGLRFKLNCVPLADMGVGQLLALLKLAHGYSAPLRFIELMPLACNDTLTGLSGREIRDQLLQAGLTLQRDTACYGNGPAAYWRVAGYSVPVGFIEPIHNKFCSSCNRVRLTSVGVLQPCLYSGSGLSLKRMLRDGLSDVDILAAMRETIGAKPLGHQFDASPARFSMNQIGG